MSEPAVKISVLLPVVDEWQKLSQALKSIFSQNYSDYEILIRVDGGAAPEDCPEFESSQIKWLTGPRLGLAASLNAMAQEASGQLLVRLDADDEMLPDRLASQAHLWKENPQALIIGAAIVKNERGHEIVKKELSQDFFNFKLLTINPVVHSAVAMDANVFRDLGGYNSSWQIAQDYELWVRWSQSHPVVLQTQEVCVHHQETDFTKVGSQIDQVSDLVGSNLKPFLGDLDQSFVNQLIHFSGGLGVQGKFHEFKNCAKHYRQLLEAFKKQVKNLHEFEMQDQKSWPFLLGRNMQASQNFNFVDKLSCLFYYPQVLKAYSLKALWGQ